MVINSDHSKDQAEEADPLSVVKVEVVAVAGAFVVVEVVDDERREAQCPLP